MVLESDLLRIKTWFKSYVAGFYTGEAAFDAAIGLKERHTQNVALEILDIGDSLHLGSEDCYLAEIMATLHDIGRFEQFRRYHTYSDAHSENHASLGVRVVHENDILSGLKCVEKDLITATISHHNRAALPQCDNSKLVFFLKLVRDADKIDILRVVTEKYQNSAVNDIIRAGLPDAPEITDIVAKSVIAGRIVKFETMRTANDFKLLQLSWIFDLNFPRTFSIVKQREYLDKIRSALPDTDIVEQAVSAARRHLERNGIVETQ
jgi:hypothetical protein